MTVQNSEVGATLVLAYDARSWNVALH